MGSVIQDVIEKQQGLSRTYAIMEMMPQGSFQAQELDAMLRFLDADTAPFLLEHFFKGLQRCVDSVTGADAARIENALGPLLSGAASLKRYWAVQILFTLWTRSWRDKRPFLMGVFNQDAPPDDMLMDAIELSGMLRYPELIPALVRASAHPDLQVRKKAIEAVGKIGTPEMVPVLLSALFDEEKEVREAALWGLDIFWVHCQDAVLPALIHTLNTTNSIPVTQYILATLKRLSKDATRVIVDQLEAEFLCHPGLRPGIQVGREPGFPPSRE